jgi:hypothetical protein
MRLEFNENDFMGSVTLTPETPRETAKLLRLAKNAKREPADIYMSFSGDEPYLNIAIYKRKRSVQINSLNNK